MDYIRPWNIKPGDLFLIRDETTVPARTITYRATAKPIKDRGYFSGARLWLIPRETVQTSDCRPDFFGGDHPARFYSNERVQRVKRG